MAARILSYIDLVEGDEIYITAFSRSIYCGYNLEYYNNSMKNVDMRRSFFQNMPFEVSRLKVKIVDPGKIHYLTDPSQTYEGFFKNKKLVEIPSHRPVFVENKKTGHKFWINGHEVAGGYFD